MPENDEVIISTSSHYLNSDLSLEARGALGWFLSYKGSSLAVFRNVNNIGRDKARRIINELIDAGYVIRKQVNNEDGLFEWEMHVSAFPFPDEESPEVDEPSVDNQAMVTSPPPTPPTPSESLNNIEKPTPPIVPPSLRQVRLPEEFRTKEFYETWELWVKHRKEIRHSLKQTTIVLQIKRLTKFPVAVAIEMIKRSIYQGYQGLFELSPAQMAKLKDTSAAPAMSDREFMAQFER